MAHRLKAALLLGWMLTGLLPRAVGDSDVHRHHVRAHLGMHTLSRRATDSESAVVEPIQETRHSEMLVLPTFVLTLANAAARQASMLQRLQDAAVVFAFVNGINASRQIYVDGATRQLIGSWPMLDALEEDGSAAEWTLNMTIPSICHTTTLPSVSCSLSHVLTVLAAYQAGHEMVLVLEDDMEVLRWPSKGTLSSAPPGWEVLQLYMLGKWADILYAQPPALWVPWRRGIFNTGAYIINRAGMRKIITAYLPEAGADAPSNLLTELNLSSVSGSECVADFLVYSPARAYVTTDFFFVEEGRDSGIQLQHLGLHQHTKQLVLQLAEQQSFQEDPALSDPLP